MRQPANDNEGPFSIGQNIWPGISKLIEECGEVLQICGKLIATGGRTDHWSGLNLAEELGNELGDLLAAIDFVHAHNPLNDDHGGAYGWRSVERRHQEKFLLFQRWHGGYGMPASSESSDG